jgi:hypothetical protein
MKIKFKKEEESLLNTFFLYLTYMSGDADAYEYDKVYIPGVDYTNYLDNLDKIKEVVDQYKLIGRFTDCNDKLCLTDNEDAYKYIQDNYSQELADIYDNVPTDTTCCDYLAHLSNIEIHAYNEKGELLISFID